MNISPLTRDNHSGAIAESITLAQKLENTQQYINFLIYNLEDLHENKIYLNSERINEYLKKNKESKNNNITSTKQ